MLGKLFNYIMEIPLLSAEDNIEYEFLLEEEIPASEIEMKNIINI